MALRHGGTFRGYGGFSLRRKIRKNSANIQLLRSAGLRKDIARSPASINQQKRLEVVFRHGNPCAFRRCADRYCVAQRRRVKSARRGELRKKQGGR